MKATLFFEKGKGWLFFQFLLSQRKRENSIKVSWPPSFFNATFWFSSSPSRKQQITGQGLNSIQSQKRDGRASGNARL
jgi:hypothetical protein